MVMPKPFLVTLRLNAKKGGKRQFHGLIDVYHKTLKSDGIIGLYRAYRRLTYSGSLKVFLSFSRGLTDIVSYSQIFDHDGYTRFLALEIRLLTKNSHNIYYQDGSCTRGTIQFLN
ncbi:unnamed protein product [Rhizophagus irregularis]|nr:unnamed protein product [Rhizophagus irregularis]CAB4408590.1 unnamed protein product [Rhizophagus irregularis]